MKCIKVISLLFLTIVLLLSSTFSLAENISNSLYKEGQVLYVWANKGAKLREQPSIQSKLIHILPYGASVSTLKQDEKMISHQIDFFSQKKNSNANQPKVILKGHWIKVKYKNNEGYIFDKLLLSFSPVKNNEDIDEYVIREFKLNNVKKFKKVTKEKFENKVFEYIEYHEVFTSKENSVILDVIQGEGYGGEITISDLSFDNAIVFFSKLLPPTDENIYFDYKSNSSLEYQINEVPSNAFLSKTRNGVSFSWFFELN